MKCDCYCVRHSAYMQKWSVLYRMKVKWKKKNRKVSTVIENRSTDHTPTPNSMPVPCNSANLKVFKSGYLGIPSLCFCFFSEFVFYNVIAIPVHLTVFSMSLSVKLCSTPGIKIYRYLLIIVVITKFVIFCVFVF